MDEHNTISKYDRRRAGLKNDSTLWVKPTTVQNVDGVLGIAETFIVVTALYDHPKEGGHYVFVECADDTGLTRVMLPPKVANAIERHMIALRKRRASASRKRIMAERQAQGWKPDFTPKKKKPADSSAGA